MSGLPHMCYETPITPVKRLLKAAQDKPQVSSQDDHITIINQTD